MVLLKPNTNPAWISWGTFICSQAEFQPLQLLANFHSQEKQQGSSGPRWSGPPQLVFQRDSTQSPAAPPRGLWMQETAATDLQIQRKKIFSWNFHFRVGECPNFLTSYFHFFFLIFKIPNHRRDIFEQQWPIPSFAVVLCRYCRPQRRPAFGCPPPQVSRKEGGGWGQRPKQPPGRHVGFFMRSSTALHMESNPLKTGVASVFIYTKTCAFCHSLLEKRRAFYNQAKNT